VKLLLTVKPKYLILLSIALAFILIITTSYEIVEGKREIYTAKQEEAISLLKTIQKAASNVLISSTEAESIIRNRLIDAAYFVGRLDKVKPATVDGLKQIAKQTGIEHITIYEDENNMISSSGNYAGLDIIRDHKPAIDSLNKGYYDYYFARTSDENTGEEHLSVIQKRLNNAAGFIIVSLSSKELLAFRKKIGIGGLLKNMAETDEILYIAIQDEDGILTANPAVKELSSIQGDGFIENAIKTKSFATREAEFNGETVYEAVGLFFTPENDLSVIRIGLSLKQVNSLISKTIIRSVIISLLLLLSIIALILFVTYRQNVMLLKDEYRKIQTYTGNILNSMSEGVIASDLEGKITLINPAAEKIFCVTQQEITGKSNLLLFTKGGSVIDKAILNNAPVGYTETVTEICGNKTIIIGGSADLVRNEDGSINTVIAVVKDITRQKDIEETQRRNEKLSALGELAASVAHEIKNPLNSIGIIAQRLVKEFQPSADEEEYSGMLTTVRNEVSRVSDIINRFLAFAKPREAKLTLTESSLILNEVANMYKARSAKENVRFITNIARAGINADSEYLKQAIINLLENAFEAATESGKVEMTSSISENDLVISIKDNGIGIPEENKDKIFNIYYTTKQTGSGLGLSIVNQIVANHNGTISVKSSAGNGTDFIIKIPLAQEQI